MLEKLAYSQTTLMSGSHLASHKSKTHTLTHEHFKNPYPQTLPLKLPKNPVRRANKNHMLTESPVNPEKSGVRVYSNSNRSRYFDGSRSPLTLTEKQAKHPQILRDTFNPRRLSSPGKFHNLSQRSPDTSVNLRKYEDIGAVNNTKASIPAKQSKGNPIIQGQKSQRHNSSLSRVWGEQRRHRDNGRNCSELMSWQAKPTPRQPYNKRQPYQIAKKTTYHAIHTSSKAPYARQ